MVLNEMTFKSGSGYVKNRNLIRKLKMDLFNVMVYNEKVYRAIQEAYKRELKFSCYPPKDLELFEVWEKAERIKITLKDGFVQVQKGKGRGEYSYY